MRRMVLAACCVWIFLVSASLGWNYRKAREEQELISMQAARSFFQQVLIARAWNASHGGVYVPVSEHTKPNPYLDDPLRDIEVGESLTLTKINPAFMTRQIGELARERKGVQFHITSLKPIRPENKATPLEEDALKRFEQGVHEVGMIIEGESKKTFFYMAPLKTEKACLRCHAKQGYKEGDLRGGISVTLPFIPVIPITSMLAGHMAIGAVGLLGIVIFGIKLSEAYESIRMQSIIDTLTGIPNRRSFSERILVELNRSRRDGHSLSVIMGDIDSFKLYNDTYGHNSGDECIKAVATAIQRTLRRPGDFCARYGGEEFVIVLPNTDREGAVFVAELIRAAVQNMGLTHRKSSPWGVVTISLGVATADADNPVSHEELIMRADKALYAAKGNARNRVEFYREAPTLESEQESDGERRERAL